MINKKEASKLFKKTYFWNDIFCMYYHFTESKEEFANMMEWIGQEFPQDVGGRCVLAENGGEVRIWIGLFNGELSTLVHECTHASLFTLDAIGQKLSYDDELLPYLTAWIFKECKDKMNES